ncbi:PREDICTED: odorant receptor 4-like isoform X2 [Vollenhovia emeryi]|uniref:odorant receptor 4-like isoform X2 n=1 Tax=Vollenhovia emeryi TaxID=411798 RepID=UPI0005F552D7|nr:PREDICTED: odorant receptor 4-like isoform X2 [Vollenhovia emeryi]
MICIETKYFNLNRVLLLALGLWPYYRSNIVRLQIILCLSLVIGGISFQLARFITTKCTSDLIIEVFSTVTFYSTYIINYNAFWMNMHNVRQLMEKLQQICNELKDENEINIMKQYGNSVKRYTFFIINVVVCIGATTIAATGTLLRGYFIHACGLFKIASYRIEQAMMIKMVENISTKNEMMVYKEIICAIDIQRKAIKYSQFILSSFEGSFILLISVNVVSLSLNLFGIFRSVSLGNREAFILHSLMVSVILLYMFLANYTGQEVMDHDNYIYLTAYNIRWYIAPVHIQKLILFILQKNSKAFALHIGKIFVASLECFATLLKASMSYFTFMYSTQQ